MNDLTVTSKGPKNNRKNGKKIKKYDDDEVLF